MRRLNRILQILMILLMAAMLFLVFRGASMLSEIGSAPKSLDNGIEQNIFGKEIRLVQRPEGSTAYGEKAEK